MTLRLSATLLFLSSVGVLGILAAINQFKIVDAVNAKLPLDSQFNSFGWWPRKTWNLHKQYRRLYPSGGLLRRQGILAAAMFLCTTVAAGLIGFSVFAVAGFGVFGALSVWLGYFRKATLN